MNVLIAFGTTEGQTRKIARNIARTLKDSGHNPHVYDCSDRTTKIDLDNFEAVILAASVHHKKYQACFYDFIASNRTALKQMPTAFVSVSLAITLASGEDEARSYVDDLITETDIKFDAIHLAEGAVRYFEYSASEASTINMIVFKGQRKMPERNGNPEYTDWKALDAFILQFTKDTAQSIIADANADSRNA